MNQQQLNKQLAYFYVQFHGIVLPLQKIHLFMKGIETIDASDIKNCISKEHATHNQDGRNEVGKHFILVRE